MSVLSLADHGATDDNEPKAAEGATGATEAETVEPAPPPEPVAVPLPQKRLSRREEAALADRKKVEDLERKFEEQRRQWDQERSQLHTALATRPSQVIQQAPPPVQQTQAPDPEEIYQKAFAALDRNDPNEYHRLTRQAQKAERDREWAERQRSFAPPQQQQQAPMDPVFVATLAQYPDVMGSPVGAAYATAEDQILAASGYQPGPQRLTMALQAARARIQGSQRTATPGYDQRSAAALSSAPANGRTAGAASNGAGGPSLMFESADQERTARAVAKKSGMTWDEYTSSLAGLYPSSVRK